MVDPTVVIAVIGTAGVALTALTAYLGVRFTARQSASAQTRTAEAAIAAATVEDRKAQATEWSMITDALGKSIDNLREDRDLDRQEIGELRRRIVELEADRRKDRFRIEVLTSYITALIKLLKDNGIEHPPTPAELQDS